MTEPATPQMQKADESATPAARYKPFLLRALRYLIYHTLQFWPLRWLVKFNLAMLKYGGYLTWLIAMFVPEAEFTTKHAILGFLAGVFGHVALRGYDLALARLKGPARTDLS